MYKTLDSKCFKNIAWDDNCAIIEFEDTDSVLADSYL